MCVGALQSAEGCVIARRVGNQLRRFLIPPRVRLWRTLLHPSSLLAPEALLCAQGKIRLVPCEHGCPHCRYRSIWRLFVGRGLAPSVFGRPMVAPTDVASFACRFAKRVFFERGPGVAKGKRGSPRGVDNHRAALVVCPLLYYAYGDSLYCIGAPRSTE